LRLLRRRFVAAIFRRLLGFKLDLYLSGRRQKDRRVTAKELETRAKASRVLVDAKLVAQLSLSLVK